MKSIIICLFFFPVLAYCQVKVDGVDINQLPEVKYLEIVMVDKGFGPRVTVVIDYGQSMRPQSHQRIEKEDGKPVVFNSRIEVLNFMEMNGWTYLDNSEDPSGEQNVYRYILKRKE